MNPTPFFLTRDDARLFTLRYAGQGRTPRARILIAPPFADELNKCRALLAHTARRLSDAGFEVLQVDLYGTGDSTGEFAEASWDVWVADLRTAHALLSEESDLPLILLGVRTGALFALALAHEVPAFQHLLFWQPVVSGEAFLKQFLRVRVMASKFAGHDESVADLLALLEQGTSVEVGGYAICSRLAKELRELNLNALVLPPGSHIDILEFKPKAADGISPALAKWASALSGTGIDARCTVVDAEPFWASQEVIVPTAVARVTEQILTEHLPV